MKQLRIKAKNKLKDVILPTNPPTPKSKKNELNKKPINKSKENAPLIINENKKLPKNLSFHYLHATGNISSMSNLVGQQVNYYEGHASPNSNGISNFNMLQNGLNNNVNNIHKKLKKD
jgi:hypothetical protein